MADGLIGIINKATERWNNLIMRKTAAFRLRQYGNGYILFGTRILKNWELVGEIVPALIGEQVIIFNGYEHWQVSPILEKVGYTVTKEYPRKQ